MREHADLSRNGTGDADGGDSYFVSVSDMMTGFLFIFIIMLMFFVLRLSIAEANQQSVTTQLVSAEETRAQILRDISSRLKSRGIIVEVDDANGILRLPEKLLFSKGSADITRQGREDIGHVASAMSIVMPCYAGKPAPLDCPPSSGGRLETVLVEGHTDPDAFAGGGRIRNNWQLSVFRAINTYRALTLASPTLGKLRNDGKKSVLGVSGYGEFRPLNDNRDEGEKTQNRRIDLRFIMETPRPEIVRRVRSAVELSGRESK